MRPHSELAVELRTSDHPVDIVEAGLDVALRIRDFEIERLPIYAVLPPTRYSPAKTRLFLDLLAERLRRQRW